MLRSTRDLHGYKVHATDGEAGHLGQFYFDDQTWKVRYIVVNVGNWLHRKEVLISPRSITKVDDFDNTIRTTLTTEQILNSAGTYTHKPVAFQQPTDIPIYFGWPPYYGPRGSNIDVDSASENDPHLRTTEVVGGYHIMAADSEVGHIEDFIVDDQTWKILYAVADTRNWWPGKKVLLATDWISWLSQAEFNAYVNVLRERIVSAPEFDSEQPLTRDFEIKLYTHYKRLPYWEQKSMA